MLHTVATLPTSVAAPLGIVMVPIASTADGNWQQCVVGCDANETGLALSRAQRLLDLIQLLRRHRRPVSGAIMADELGVSLRTIYRDIETLKGQGAQIDGEPGLGYVLRPGFMLPLLMFSEAEIDALVLGSRWSPSALTGAEQSRAQRAGEDRSVLPDDIRQGVEHPGR
jgi:predicted DNA-binding transcriptional regulator YafY